MDDCILKTDNRTEIGTSLDVDADMYTGTAAVCTRGASNAIRAMQGEIRGANYSKADTTRTTALTRKTTGESTVSTPVRLSMGEPAVPGTTPLPAEKTGTTPPLVATTETTPLPAEKTGTTLPLVETTKLSPSPQRRQALRLPW